MFAINLTDSKYKLLIDFCIIQHVFAFLRVYNIPFVVTHIPTTKQMYDENIKRVS